MFKGSRLPRSHVFSPKRRRLPHAGTSRIRRSSPQRHVRTVSVPRGRRLRPALPRFVTRAVRPRRPSTLRRQSLSKEEEPHRQSHRRRLRDQIRRVRQMSWFLCLVGGLLLLSTVSGRGGQVSSGGSLGSGQRTGSVTLASSHVTDTTTLSGNGGGLVSGSLSVNMTCGHPADIFAQFGYPASAVPDQQALMQLPRPNPKQQAQQSLTYDPTTGRLCVQDMRTLVQRYGSPAPVTSGSTNLVTSMLAGVSQSFAQGLATFLNGVIDWASSFGFLWITPKILTYGQAAVVNLHTWVIGIMDGAVVLVLMVAGYLYLLGREHHLRDLLLRLALATITANFSLFFITQVIELHNALCVGLQGALATVGIGNLSFTWQNTFNLLNAPNYWVAVYLLDLLMSVLLVLERLVGLALIDLCIIVAPLGLLCFALPQTSAYGRLWLNVLVSTLLVQFLQEVCIGLGGALVAGFGSTSLTPVSLLVGFAALYLAFKVPGMLLSRAVQHSIGAVNRDAITTVKTVGEIAAIALA